MTFPTNLSTFFSFNFVLNNFNESSRVPPICFSRKTMQRNFPILPTPNVCENSDFSVITPSSITITFQCLRPASSAWQQYQFRPILA
ncbi:MAG: hypothetical protein LBL90_02370 [Prevotellaceae bacterium]|nr:hypothetical protein [Prevotellaceae bacterium]